MPLTKRRERRERRLRNRYARKASLECFDTAWFWRTVFGLQAFGWERELTTGRVTKCARSLYEAGNHPW